MSKGRDVLIVDDDPDVRELFAFVLRDAGARVVAVDSGEAGVRAAASFRPDLVITDISMPRMDGIEMVRQLRVHDRTKNIPVVAFTGQILAGIPEKARGAGCAEVLAKPCEPEALVRTINRHIGRRCDDRSRGTSADCGRTDRRIGASRLLRERRRPCR
jgi:two-component system cell cycle response regulator DivK